MGLTCSGRIFEEKALPKMGAFEDMKAGLRP
jgi:hypothetical protein